MTNYLIFGKGTDRGSTMLKKSIDFLKNGSYFVVIHYLDPHANIETYRGTYFMKLQLIADETGHDKNAMHAIVKEHVIEPLTGKNSTKDLTLEEWLGVIRSLEIWAFQTY